MGGRLQDQKKRGAKNDTRDESSDGEKNSVKTFHQFFSRFTFLCIKLFLEYNIIITKLLKNFHIKYTFLLPRAVITRNYLFGAFFKFHLATLYLFLKGPLSDFSTCKGRCCKKIEATRKLRQLKPFAVKLKSYPNIIYECYLSSPPSNVFRNS